MLHMLRKASESGAGLKSSKGDFVCGYRRKTREGDWKRVMMKERNAKQGQSKQNEVDGNSQQKYGFDHGRGLNVSR